MLVKLLQIQVPENLISSVIKVAHKKVNEKLKSRLLIITNIRDDHVTLYFSVIIQMKQQQRATSQKQH